MAGKENPIGRHLLLSTISFAICFALWGLVGALGPIFRETYGLSGTQAALLVVVPVLLGSLARIPIGMLTDRFGARLVFTALMTFVAFSALLVPQVTTYSGLLATAFLIGIAGSSFAVGVGYVSGWASADRQGSVLGIYGLGTIGQSAAVFLGPLLARAAIFGLLARDATRQKKPHTIEEMISLLRNERLAWALGGFYFLTFGGFVAFSIYLPLLLRDQFGLTLADAGFRTAGFVVLATSMRPAGGWLADQIGGSRVLQGVFAGIIVFALLMAWPSILPFTVGALGCALLLGLGNGAVFKLVPQYFPDNTGVVTGLVGAMGGLGGFFPPLLLGLFRDHFGLVWRRKMPSLCPFAVRRPLFARAPSQHSLLVSLWPQSWWVRAIYRISMRRWSSIRSRSSS